jgi:hypothetical protein
VSGAQRWQQRNSMVPLHVEYTMTRLGELVMLMLGEGVLSLVISTEPVTVRADSPAGAGYKRALAEAASSSSGSAYGGSGGGVVGADGVCDAGCFAQMAKASVSFASGFMVLTGIMYLYYRSNPTGHGTRHHHAMRRNSIRGICWNLSHFPLCLGLIAIGVAIKAIHPYALKPVPRKYVFLLSVAAAASLPAVAFQQLMHPGVRAFVRAPGARMRVGLWLCKLVLSYAMLGMLLLPPETEGYLYHLYACVLALATAVCVIYEKLPTIESRLWAWIEEQEGQADGGAKVNTSSVVLPTIASGTEAGRYAPKPQASLSHQASESSSSSDSDRNKPDFKSAACMG